MNARPIVRALSMLLVPACLCGCFEVDQEISIDSEGAVIAKLKYSAPASTVEQLESMALLTTTLQELGAHTNLPPADPADSILGPQLFDFEYVKQHIESRKGPGVRVSQLEKSTRQSWHEIELKGSFDDIGKLREIDHFAGQKISLKKLENGNYELLMRLVREGDYDIPTLETGTDDYRTVMSVFSGFRVLIKVRVPGRIVSASTYRKTDRSATWSFDIKRNPNALRELHNPLRIEFNSQGMDLREFPPPAL